MCLARSKFYVLLVLIVALSACGASANEVSSSTSSTQKPKDVETTQETPEGQTPRTADKDTLESTAQKVSTTRKKAEPFKRQTNKESVYLTFDGGPGPRTPEFLDALESWDAKATFFVTGSYTQKDPEMLKRIVAAGHTIANHSWDHPDMTTISDDRVSSQLERTQKIVQEVTAIEMTCWRPPFGATNSSVQDKADELGLTNSKWIKDGRWDVDTIDWREGYDFVLKRLQTVQGGDVVLMHSGNNPDEEDLAALVTWMETNKNTYRFEALPGC